MKRIIFTLLLCLVAGPVFGATYYVQDGGAGTLEQSTNISTPMSVTTFNASTFSSGDIIYFMGTFDLSATEILIPSSGTSWSAGEYITYSSYSSDPAILDGGGKDWMPTFSGLIDTNDKNYIEINSFTFTDMTSSSASAGNALEVINSIMRGNNLVFTGWVNGSTGGAWVESGGNGDQSFVNCTFEGVDDEAISNHTPGTYSLSFTGCSFNKGILAGLAMQLVNTPTSLVFTSCSFDGNGIAWSAINLPTDIIYELNRCSFHDVVINSRGATINYSIFDAPNTAATMYFNITDGNITVNNCVFYGDSGTNVVNSFTNSARTAVIEMNNCIIYDAQRVVSWAGTGTGGEITLTNCIVYLTTGEFDPSGGNGYTEINVSTSDPLFVSPGTNYRPQIISPLIYAGTDVSLTSDYDGKPIRGATPNIGAYESWPGIF